MEVSVIIPVYNAEKYVREAVESALAQPETGEVILIEDGSPDHAIAVCRELEKGHSKVKLFQHPNSENRGAGASRNLGIKNANCEFIAFLDADDFYLRDRFTVPKNIFSKYSTIEGVYEAVGTHFQNKEAERKWFSIRSYTLTTLKKNVEPEVLFESLLSNKVGFFHTNGIIVRKSVFDKVGNFDVPLKMKQDSAMWLKMSAVCKLVAGRLTEPVAMRRVHQENRILSVSKEKESYYQALLWEILSDWGLKSNLPPSKLNLLLERYLGNLLSKGLNQKTIWSRKGIQIKLLGDAVVQNPSLLKCQYFWYCFGKVVGLYKAKIA